MSLSQTSVYIIGDASMNLTSPPRNNHMKLHRKALRDAVQGSYPPVRLLALNWALGEPHVTIHSICSGRICNRGENHQTLKADVHEKSHENVIWQFIKQTEGLEDKEVDAIIEMDINEDLEHALDRAVDGCVRILGLEKPDQEKVGLALAAVRDYERTKKKKEGKRQGGKPTRYYGFEPNVDLLKLLQPVFSAGGGADVTEGKEFFAALIEGDRITKRPHITIVHSKSTDSESRQLWNRCSELSLSPTPSAFQFNMGSVVWNDQVMAVSVELQDGGDEVRKLFVDQLPQKVRNKLHITVGTANRNIGAYTAHKLMEDWRDGQGVKSLQLTNVPSEGRIRGFEW